MVRVSSLYEAFHPSPVRLGDDGQELFADEPGVPVVCQNPFVEVVDLDVLEVAVRVRERRSHELVAEEQPGAVQQLADQGSAAAVEPRYDQLIAQGPFSSPSLDAARTRVGEGLCG